MKLFEEFKEYETMWDLTEAVQELENLSQFDPKITNCEICGKVAKGCLGPFESWEVMELPPYISYEYLKDVFGEKICTSCAIHKSKYKELFANDSVGGLSTLYRRLGGAKKGLEKFKTGDISGFSIIAGGLEYSLPLWNKYRNMLRIPDSEKHAIDRIIIEYANAKSSKQYIKYKKQLEKEAEDRRQQTELERKTSQRAPKTDIKRSRYLYFIYQDFDTGEYNIVFADKSLKNAKAAFKQEAYDFVIDGSNADQSMWLFKINVAAIQDQRFLDLLAEFSGDLYPTELTDEQNELMSEYAKKEFWSASWATCLAECHDVDAVEECYSEDLDPNDLIASGEWKDWVKEYIDREYPNF